MAMNSLKININTQANPSFKEQRVTKPYLEAQGAINTDDNVHPLPPQGHLIHDNFNNSVKYFFKDIEYDLKSVKNGIKGTANDHQSGRLNDVGLTLAGILIATYLASKTTNPKARVMEYVGLGAFLTAMSIYPKLAINTPAKLMHGYDIDKQYIDDQGRKKSVMQDSNYVPYDMYLGEIPEEDIAIIGDKMGIPRDIKNRNDVTREQMRKVATQSNTLWMLTAGVTPALAALMCCGLENYVVAPAIEKTNLIRYNNSIANALEKTTQMTSEISKIDSNSLSDKVQSLLKNYKGQELPKEEFDNLVKILSEDLFDNTAEGIKEDITKILKTSASKGSESVIISEATIKEMLYAAEDSITKTNKKTLEKVLVPSKEELETILKKFVDSKSNLANGTTTSIENIAKIKDELKSLLDSKIQNTTGIPKEFLNSQRNEILENITKTLKTQKSSYVSEEAINKIVDFAKVLGEFKDNQKVIKKCKEFSVEFANETIIARSYDKFEKTLLDELGIKFSDLKKMRESEEFTKELLDKKFAEVCKDEARFKKTMEKLGKVISEMEVKLNGKDESGSKLLDIINATENNYNNTAKRLSKIGSFESTIDRMVKQNVETLGNNIHSRQELFDFLDGITPDKAKDLFLNDKKWANLSEEEQLRHVNEQLKNIFRGEKQWSKLSNEERVNTLAENWKSIFKNDRQWDCLNEKDRIKNMQNKLKNLFKQEEYLNKLNNDDCIKQVSKHIKNTFKNEIPWHLLNEEERIKYITSNSNGIGSSKNLEISRILERYQGAKNSFNRIIHTFDVYKRSLTPENFAEALRGKDPKYVEEILKKAKDALLHASAPDHTMKLDTVNNPTFYKDLMNSVWASEAGNFYSTKQKGLITEATKEALSKHNELGKGNLLDRFQYYITRFRNLVGNSTVDFTKPHHILNPHIREQYTTNEKTRMAFFNLVGQTPVDMAKGAASRRFATQKWVRIISAITGSVFGIAVLAQLGFGKLSNPQNLQKQVNDDTSK